MRADEYDDDDPQSFDMDPDDDDGIDETDMACPNCRAAVTADANKCPACGDWITPVYPSSGSGRRWLFIVAVVLMLLVMVFQFVIR